MTETKLEIKTNGQYNNIDLKGLEDGQYIIVEKVFAEGYKFESKKYTKKDGTPTLSFSCKVKYDGKDVTFWLNEIPHNTYKVTGGIGDKVKITAKEEKRINPKTKVKTLVNVLHFEKVN